MKKTISLFFSIALACLLLDSCSDPEFEDSGKIRQKEKTYPLADFTSISASSGIDVVIKPGIEYSVQASGDSRNLADLKIETITGDHLLIQYTNNAKRQHLTRIEITMPVLLSVSVTDGASANIDGFYDIFSLDNLVISATDHSVVLFNGIAETIYAHAVYHSMIDLSGQGDKVESYVASESQFGAFSFQVQDARVEAVMKSKAQVNASDKLYAKVVNTSEVIYKGTPTVTSLVDGSSIFGPN
jgi:hypothetical protein